MKHFKNFLWILISFFILNSLAVNAGVVMDRETYKKMIKNSKAKSSPSPRAVSDSPKLPSPINSPTSSPNVESKLTPTPTPQDRPKVLLTPLPKKSSNNDRGFIAYVVIGGLVLLIFLGFILINSKKDKSRNF